MTEENTQPALQTTPPTTQQRTLADELAQSEVETNPSLETIPVESLNLDKTTSPLTPRKATATSPEKQRESKPPTPTEENKQAALKTNLPTTTQKVLADELAQAERETTPSLESLPVDSINLDRTASPATPKQATATSPREERDFTPPTPAEENKQPELQRDLPTTEQQTLAEELAQTEGVITPPLLKSATDLPTPKQQTLAYDITQAKGELTPPLKCSPLSPIKLNQTASTAESIHFGQKHNLSPIDSVEYESAFCEDEELFDKFRPHYYRRPNLPVNAKEWSQRAISVLLFVASAWLCYQIFAFTIPFTFRVIVKTLLFPFTIGSQLLELLQDTTRVSIDLFNVAFQLLTPFHLAVGAILTELLVAGLILEQKRYLILAGAIFLSIILPPFPLSIAAVLLGAWMTRYTIKKTRYFILFALVAFLTRAAIEAKTIGPSEAALWWLRSISVHAWNAHVRVADFYDDYTRWVLEQSGARATMAHRFPLRVRIDDRWITFVDGEVNGTSLKVRLMLVQLIAPFLARVFMSIHLLAVRWFGSACVETCVANRWPHWCAASLILDRLSWDWGSLRYLWRYRLFWYKDFFQWWRVRAQALGGS